MGYYSYYTRFSLSIHEGDEFSTETEWATTVGGEKVEIVRNSGDVIEQMCSLLEQHSGYSADTYKGHDEVNWYSCYEDMCEVSRKFPNHVFALKGEGEETGDLWICYFKNGKGMKCPGKITYEPYDESRLS